MRATITLLLALVLGTSCTGPGEDPRRSTPPPEGALLAEIPTTLVGAGDIAGCTPAGPSVAAIATAVLLDSIDGTVFTLGDNAYEAGSVEQFRRCYAPTWGRHRARTIPAPGNHEYVTPNAAGYFEYFGAAAGDPTTGYYSLDLRSWHIVVLNSAICDRDLCTVGSPQETWLRAELEAHPTRCALAIWHHPLFSSGFEGDTDVAFRMRPLFRALYDHGVDVLLTGHAHDYERFAPQDPVGNRDDVRGVREFVVGTGGKDLTPVGPPIANSMVLQNDTYGLLKLTLWRDRYDWSFIPVPPGRFSDSGSAECH